MALISCFIEHDQTPIQLGTTYTDGVRSVTPNSVVEYYNGIGSGGDFTYILDSTVVGYPWSMSIGMTNENGKGGFFASTLPSTLILYGTVTVGGTGLGGVLVQAGGHGDGTETDGTYAIQGVPTPFTGNIVPTKDDYTFNPAQISHSGIYLAVDGNDFTGIPVPPTKATTPAPANAATNVTLDQATLTWVDGGGATSYNVYYGTQSGNLTLVSEGQAGTSFTVSGITNGSPYDYLITRYWRIDSINNAGTTTGDEWSFTTIRLDVPTPIYWYSIGSYYYQLLIKTSGVMGTPPPTGVENTDYVILASTYLPNFIRTNRILVAAANNKMWYESA